MKIDMKGMLGILLVSSVLILSGNAVIYIKAGGEGGAIQSITKSIPGMMILIGFSMAGLLCKQFIPLKLPAAAYIITIGCILSIPGAPGATDPMSLTMNAISGTIMTHVNEISFMSLTTPVLAYAGLSLAKDLDALLMSGWRLVLVSAFVFIGTFLGSAVIADVVLRMLGQV